MITPVEWDSFSDVTWRTSSYSGNGGNCVEVGWRRDAEALVRDSKAPSGGALRVAVPAWRAFLTALDRR
ncbi:DUF397 domain-containing protein [Haloechinothrix sp. YIM 98757]|uniref:DUF397 domain-containing protein n=1 Tax=Haloechinothrix aidingensis TaxID=2752311 RepID=A0A838A7J0_9PSEU|nr:DUF397 domain-containing protein [Haloechinothrix aidingensis]MBA0124517.1 DUF397 domain-containing protein [Haloechinothrix aidingensis]